MTGRIEGIEEEDLRRMYEVEKMTKQEIANEYGVSPPVVSKRMLEYVIETRSINEARRVSKKYRTYAINKEFFREWSKEMSWMYGWALGDGCFADSFSHGRNLRFELSSKDREVLVKFKDLLESEHLIKDHLRWNEKHQKLYSFSTINFYSIELVADLKELFYGDVPDEFMADFIRGFWEAEGSVGLHTMNEAIISNFSQKDTRILKFIWAMLKYEKIVEGGWLGEIQLFFGEADSVALYDYMYGDCGNLFLKRKKERFEELMEYRGYL